MHSTGLLLQWLVICTHSGGSSCWTNSATVRPPAWHPHRPTYHLSTHLVPSSSAKWESPSLWGVPQAGPYHWEPQKWYSNTCLQEYLYHLQRWSTPAVYRISVPGTTLRAWSNWHVLKNFQILQTLLICGIIKTNRVTEIIAEQLTKQVQLPSACTEIW